MTVALPEATRPHALRRARRAPVPALVTACWAALFVNVLGWSDSATLIPIPHLIGQLIAQAALALAVILALLANRTMAIRPQLVLVLLLVMAVVAVMVSVHSVYLRGSTYRAFRFVGFVAVLWLLSPWFGRRDLALLRTHLVVMRVVLGSVILGAAISPGLAFSFEGRLSGTIWPIPPTQVAHYAAVLLGLTVLLWLSHVVSGRSVLLTLAVAGPLLLATHTRTALLACLVGLAAGGAGLFLSRARVRRTAVLAVVGATAGGAAFAPQLLSWMLRGQSTQDAADLTGRTKVWSQIAGLHRDRLHTIFGDGISNMSYNGLPIDSSWMSTYLDEGWFGLTLQASVLILSLGLALTRGRGPRRAIALFIVSYCAIASITETGLGAPSPYLLDMAAAVAVLATPLPRRARTAA